MLGYEISHLANLLKDSYNQNDSDSEDEGPKTKSANLTPASFVSPQAKNTTEKAKAVVSSKKELVNTKDIWNIDEVPDRGNESIPTEKDDTRPQPEYDMHYKQNVTSEDIFLQMGNKNPSSASCEDLVVKIQLPDTELSEIVLDITKNLVDCRSKKYRLALPLPHPCDPDKCQAKWNKEQHTLQITVRLQREYDDFNF
ncbi:unnamed protein product [Didymodactylos carnosus]|uniref:PIH1D1/2/3 CS-like domain-containing protein n=1 Tax=Didymodactylos carnosus TaxID=1234261 RepID=A0A814GBP6_9BILA|nr:unnamed protein product [Didymodactylos carnosus]CAF1168207.1 unnamed protein product [Didymodactylos carnosus]CAF3764084.1 unnamed protein product [Didymodactylos carnosus]CAF3979683.1 unnamed protein product [Didymodactylos carnosus]